MQISPSKQRHGKPSVSAHAPFSKISTSETHTEHLFIWLQLTIMQILYGYPDILTLLVSPYKKVPTSITNSGACSILPFFIPKPKRVLWAQCEGGTTFPSRWAAKNAPSWASEQQVKGHASPCHKALLPEPRFTTNGCLFFFGENTKFPRVWDGWLCLSKKGIQLESWKSTKKNLPKITQISQKWWSN